MEAKVQDISHQIAINASVLILNGEEQEVDIQYIDAHTVSMIRDGKQVKALISEVDTVRKKVTLVIYNTPIEVQLRDDMDILLDDMGISIDQHDSMEDLISPMPGLIMEVKVQAGQEVKKGDVLLVLEAMKMENSLKASAQGIVNEVLVEEKQSVEKGQSLISFK